METQTWSVQTVQSNYTVPMDYVAIAVIFFVLGFLFAYKTAIGIAANMKMIYHSKID